VSPNNPSARRRTVSIVGPGNLGSALALTLSSAGFAVTTIAARKRRTASTRANALAKRVGARLVKLGSEALDADIVWLTVPDDDIGSVASNMAKAQSWRNKLVFHSSGALTSEELSPLRERGARVASIHPMMTFVRGETPEMAGVSFAIEGDPAAVRAGRSIVEALGGNAFTIQKEKKVLYHTFGSFASPMVIALMASMEEVALAAGIPKRDIKSVMVPLLWQTLRNYLKKDAASAFSGPLMRGDVATIRKHLYELKKVPQVREVYIALCKLSLETLPVKNRKTIAQSLR
jgi:predicted short-subunit dehydrogenase-like oxidoreductase (DUF2520 family)